MPPCRLADCALRKDTLPKGLWMQFINGFWALLLKGFALKKSVHFDSFKQRKVECLIEEELFGLGAR